MQRNIPQRQVVSLAPPMFWSSDHLLREIQITLAALADLECRYEIDREQLAQDTGPDAAQQHRCAERERRHQQEREPYVRRLDELERRLRALTSDARSVSAGSG